MPNDNPISNLSLNKALEHYEGYEVEEAVLTTKKRENLPSSAFCGPNRTYPAHDAAHVKSGLTRLAQFGDKLDSKVKDRIFDCLKRRGKRLGINVEESLERQTDTDELIEWYLKKLEKEKK